MPDLDLTYLRRKAEATPLDHCSLVLSRGEALAIITAAEERDRLRAELADARRHLTIICSEFHQHHPLIKPARAYLARTSPPPDRVGQIVAWARAKADAFFGPDIAWWYDRIADEIEAGDPFKETADGK